MKVLSVKKCILTYEDGRFISSKSGVDPSRNHGATCVTKKVPTDGRTDGFSSLYSRLANVPALSCRSRRLTMH